MKRTKKIFLIILLSLCMMRIPLDAQSQIGIQIDNMELETRTFLPVKVGESIITGLDKKIPIKNTGTIPITICLRMVNNSAGWKPVKHQPGNEEIRIFGLFHEYKVPLSDDFLEEDVILSESKSASSNVFALDDKNPEKKGYNIPPHADDKSVRDLFFRIDAPSSTTIIEQNVDIRILIKAIPYTLPEPEKITKPTQVVFTPNNDGINDVLRFPGIGDKFTVKILDMRSHTIRIIKGKDVWDGKDNDGKYVPSGAYVYQYQVEDKYITGIIVIAK